MTGDEPLAAVEAEVRALDGMDLGQLRETWSRRIGAAPRLRSPRLLRLHLAWRLQAYGQGGLEAGVVRALKEKEEVQPPLAGLRPGARLARDWMGERHEVEVVEDGFLYRGERHRSLSSIARLITGARWNGPRFFGLRREAS